MPRTTDQLHLRKAWENGTLPAALELLVQNDEDMDGFLLSYFRCNKSKEGTKLLPLSRLQQYSEIESLRTSLLAIISSRYLQARVYLPRCTNWVSEILPGLKEETFKHLMSMSRRDFSALLHQIEDGPGRKIFQNKSRDAQAPVCLQFALALIRFGFSGNAASLLNISLITRCSIGAVQNAYSRVMRSLVLMAADEIRWPSESERMELRIRAAQHGFPFAFFAVDGTTIPLCEKPCIDHEAFFDR